MHKLTTRIIAFVLVLSTLFYTQTWDLKAMAEQDQTLDTLYISEVKLFYAISEATGRAACEAEGFTFCPEDVMTDANKAHAYLGYKTTTNPGDAITDLTLLDMKQSYYRDMTYAEFLEKHLGEFTDQASDVMQLVNEMRRLYEAGSPNATAAYDTLNMFYLDGGQAHSGDNLLGNYLLNKADVTFFEKYIQRGNAQILGVVVNALGYAVSDYGGEGATWVDRSKTSAVESVYAHASSAERIQYDTWYKDLALEFFRQIREFRTTYSKAKALYDEHGVNFGYEGLDENSGMTELLQQDTDCLLPEYVNAMTTYTLMSQYVYQEAEERVVKDAALLYDEDEEAVEEATVVYTERKLLSEYLLELAADDTLSLHPEKLYPIIESMTAAQRTALRVCGLSSLIKGLFQAEDYKENRETRVAEAKQELREHGFPDGDIFIWHGVDQSLYTKKIAETSDKIEMENAGKVLDDSVNAAAREAASDLTIGLQIADIASMVVSAVGMLIQVGIGTSLWVAGTACFAACSAASIGMSVLLGIAGVLLCALYVINILVLVVSIAYMVYMILDANGLIEHRDPIDYSKIPNVLFHGKTNAGGAYRLRYDAVPSNANYDLVMQLWLIAGGYTEENIITGMIEAGFDYLFTDTVPEEDVRSDVADLAGFLGILQGWTALYTSKAPAAGKPIRVVPGQSFFRLQKGDHTTPAGCRAVTLICGRTACNIHCVDVFDKQGTPTYMFLNISDGAEPAAPETPEPEPSETEETPDPYGGETAAADQYVTRVRLAHAGNKVDAVNSLKKDGFLSFIDVNLTPDNGFTYLGYQMGSEQNALTDLRVGTLGVDKMVFGSASYSRAGLETSGMTSDGLAIFSTTDKNAGTPITKITLEYKRLPLGSGAEPVCLFSGGNAVDFKHKWTDNQHLDLENMTWLWSSEEIQTGQDDCENGHYLYFWPKVQYKAKTEGEKAPYVAGFSYFLAVDSDKSTGAYGTNAAFMRKFAEANGFELVTENGSAAKMMSADAGKMNFIGSWQDCEGGALGHDWRYDIYHYQYKGSVNNHSDHAVGDNFPIGNLLDDSVNTEMYFGVSYTWNPYRAITGVSGLLSAYSETTRTLRYTGLTTPAGTMQVSNVSIMGHPITHAGIAFGYYNAVSMISSLYPNRDIKQKSDLSWLSGGETEVLSRYLLTAGPSKGRTPIGREEIAFVTNENPGEMKGFVPVCDMRSPGDYDHPMNFALDTSNLGSEHLYIYLKNDAGGRTESPDGPHNVYSKKTYVAAVVCGVGKTPDEAMNNLYSQMASVWPSVAQSFPDVSATPLVTEFDEVLPVDLSDGDPWYSQYRADTTYCDPANDEWVYGNPAANLRWGHRYVPKEYTLSGHQYISTKPADDFETLRECAYIGVIRTGYTEESVTRIETKDDGTEEEITQTVYPTYAILKYYLASGEAPDTLHVGSVTCYLAGGPVKSREGTYYLYYSTNSATSAFTAPITEIDAGTEAFINGYNTSFSCSSTDRVNFKLPEYSQLRMRVDEQMYIHTRCKLEDMPYIEHLYIGVGSTKTEAFADLIGTTNASAACAVNCNHNGFSGKWIAIGYRRTNDVEQAVKDLVLYCGGDPPDEFDCEGYDVSVGKSRGQTVMRYSAADVTYYLIKHNLKVGAEALSMNEGSGGPGLYLYYTKGNVRCAYAQAKDAELFPIRNLAFSYGDISPIHASTEQLAGVYGATLHGMSEFDAEAYSSMRWEYVLGVTGSPAQYRMDGSAGFPMDLNYGVLPMQGNGSYHSGDRRIMMYVDRGSFAQLGTAAAMYQPRPGAALSNGGYYSDTDVYGVLWQKTN